MSSITAFEAKNRLGRLLDRVKAGEKITITRHGEPVAVLSPVVPSDHGQVDAALKTFKRIRDTLERKGTKVSRKQVREWISEGRR